MSTQPPELQRKLAQGLSKIALAIRHSQQATADAAVAGGTDRKTAKA